MVPVDCFARTRDAGKFARTLTPNNTNDCCCCCKERTVISPLCSPSIATQSQANTRRDSQNTSISTYANSSATTQDILLVSVDILTHVRKYKKCADTPEQHKAATKGGTSHRGATSDDTQTSSRGNRGHATAAGHWPSPVRSSEHARLRVCHQPLACHACLLAAVQQLLRPRLTNSNTKTNEQPPKLPSQT
ncbi:hypothetical protein CBL_09169 [Carabus blaptoides fortunei]